MCVFSSGNHFALQNRNRFGPWQLTTGCFFFFLNKEVSSSTPLKARFRKEPKLFQQESQKFEKLPQG